MRTLAAGTTVVRRTPIAILPIAFESLAAGILVALGAFPRGAESAAAGGVFPLNLFFDLKQSIAFGFSWPSLVAALIVSVIVRSGVLAATLWLADGRRGSIALPWGHAARYAALAMVALLPAGILMYVGVAVRYAPFIWLGAAAGFLPAVGFARRALTLDAGAGGTRGRGVPEAPQFLAYAYLLCALGAAMSSLGRVSPLLAAALVACVGPLHALVLLGWREHLRAETYPGGGTLSLAVTAIALLAFTGAVTYDRLVRDPAPVATADAPGALLLLGGADSTSRTGALADLDPRDLGFAREDAVMLSYSGAGEPYDAADTRADLGRVAERVAAQIEAAPSPRLMLGHSQASLILDRMVTRGLPAPDRSVVLSPAPPTPPPVRSPAPSQKETGAVGADIARGFAKLLDLAGLTAFDIDAPASPTNLEPVVVIDKRVSRVSVWALGDSVWLDGDWRRPGEVNIVAMTDHVGAVNNSRALDEARTFLNGGSVEGDEVSWRGLAATVLRYAFEPWRPG